MYPHILIRPNYVNTVADIDKYIIRAKNQYARKKKILKHPLKEIKPIIFNLIFYPRQHPLAKWVINQGMSHTPDLRFSLNEKYSETTYYIIMILL